MIMVRSLVLFTILCIAPDNPAGAQNKIHVVKAGGHEIAATVTENFVNKSMIRVECVIPRPHAVVWSVLSDYDNLEDLIPVVDESRLITNENGGKFLYQHGRAGLWFYKKDFSVTFRVREIPMSYIGFEAVKGDFRKFDGSWQVAERADGTWICHKVEIEPDFFAPGWAIRRMARGLMFETIDRVVQRCMAHRVTGGDGSGSFKPTVKPTKSDTTTETR